MSDAEMMYWWFIICCAYVAWRLDLPNLKEVTFMNLFEIFRGGRRVTLHDEEERRRQMLGGLPHDENEEPTEDRRFVPRTLPHRA
jgi:hypothetical protein